MYIIQSELIIIIHNIFFCSSSSCWLILIFHMHIYKSGKYDKGILLTILKITKNSLKGGMKAVVFTDTFQVLIMFSGKNLFLIISYSFS